MSTCLPYSTLLTRHDPHLGSCDLPMPLKSLIDQICSYSSTNGDINMFWFVHDMTLDFAFFQGFTLSVVLVSLMLAFNIFHLVLVFLLLTLNMLLLAGLFYKVILTTQGGFNQNLHTVVINEVSDFLSHIDQSFWSIGNRDHLFST